jgi:FkbM family methyltransferase
MTLISYAQNCEDIMLWRALKNVKTGFYIDIGAAWPEYDSVTKLFYDQGWHGLNVEPNPDLFEQLKQDRPLDTNLCLAVGDRSGVQVMNFLSNQGLSTLNEEIAQKHIDAGWLCHRKEVEVKKLTDIWNLNIPTGTEVHFLKIDVEGQEKAVLKGSDWSCLRPWIVLLESTLPMSQTENHHEWESILIEADYQFAYADGINRFYVAKEHSELLIFFKHPPNFFDNFIHKSIKQSAETTAQLQC